VSKNGFNEIENDYGGVKLKVELNKKIIGSWTLAKLGSGVNKKRLGDETNFCTNFCAKISYIPYYFCLLKFHPLLHISFFNTMKLGVPVT